MNYSLFISCPRNLEYLLEDELGQLGLAVKQVSPMGVYGDADLETLYKICLWSRIANRVQLILFSADVDNKDALVSCCRQYLWRDVFAVENSIAIEFHGESDFINNTMYGAQLVKDGIVDYFKQYGDRPSVDKKHPDILIHAYIKKNKLTVSLDLIGYSLHQRGYRLDAGGAPLKENVAAAILIRLGWPALAKKSYHLADPFCGSGTFLIEGAMMASNTAPGLLREDQALQNWLGHSAELWQSVREQARKQICEIESKFYGFDSDRIVLQAAQDNIAAAGFDDIINVKHQVIKDYQAIVGPGLFVCNPPYGERLKDPLSLLPLYQDIGKALFNSAQGWHAGILTTNATLAQAIGLRFDKQYNFFNGPLKAKLYCLQVDENNQLKNIETVKLNDNMQALKNRLLKNKKHLAKWLKRTGHRCYRLYDADLPNYAFAIDIYEDYAHVQEYAPPKEIPEAKAKRRVLEMMQLLPDVLDMPTSHIVFKQRRRQRGKEQYQAMAKKNQFITVSEGGAKFKVNLHDYLDTGLFLDHRPIRLLFNEILKGKEFLNCFCYTSTVSVHAALGGATTYNLDLSKTYLDWAQENFKLNHLPVHKHHFIQADCLQWLENCRKKFDVIFLDPPSFSNSKRMEKTLDIQRDHVMLVDLAMNLLKEGGVLYFSNNLKQFKLSQELVEKYQVKDITKQTIDEDFKRSHNVHRCYLIRGL